MFEQNNTASHWMTLALSMVSVFEQNTASHRASVLSTVSIFEQNNTASHRMTSALSTVSVLEQNNTASHRMTSAFSTVSVFEQNNASHRASPLSIYTGVHARGSKGNRLEWMQTDDWIAEIISERDLRCGGTWRGHYGNKHGSSFRMTDEPYAPINCRPHTRSIVLHAVIVPSKLVLWALTPCGHVDTYHLKPWSWKQYVSPKPWHLLPALKTYGVTTQMWETQISVSVTYCTVRISRESPCGVLTALMRFGGKVYCWVD
jgi:hypothetical protein